MQLQGEIFQHSLLGSVSCELENKALEQSVEHESNQIHWLIPKILGGYEATLRIKVENLKYFFLVFR
jgi:hypothetical protein